MPHRAPVHRATGCRWCAAVILSHDFDAEEAALAALADAQREDFRDLLRAVGDRPVTVRLLDAPMHEFLPASEADAEDEHQARMLEHLHEENPMLGVRGVRLALMHEGLYPAAGRGTVQRVGRRRLGRRRPARARGDGAAGSIPEELVMMLRLIRRVNQEVVVADRDDHPLQDRHDGRDAARGLLADKLAQWAEFLSFGTNDLTQLTYGFSRDDVERRMLGTYLEKGLMTASPFAELDDEAWRR